MPEQDIHVVVLDAGDEVNEMISKITMMRVVEEDVPLDDVVWIAEKETGLNKVIELGVARRTILIADGLLPQKVVNAYWQMGAVIYAGDGEIILERAAVAVAAGDYYVSATVSAYLRKLPSPEEYQLLNLLFEAPEMTYEELAAKLGISAPGVRARMKRLYSLARVHSRAGLLVYALRRWVQPEDVGIRADLVDSENDLSEIALATLNALAQFPDATFMELAGILDIALTTVKTRMQFLYIYSHTGRRASLLMEALRQGWISLDAIQHDEE